MAGDYSRTTFDPTRHYSAVLQQQGRVWLEADWNDHAAMQRHRTHVETIDVIGRCGAPRDANGFAIDKTPDGADLTISAGRLYVDGLLCELESEPVPIGFQDAGANEVTVIALMVDGLPLGTGHWVQLDARGVGVSAPLRVASVVATTGRVSFATSVAAYHVGGATLRRVTTYLTQPDYPGVSFPGTLTSPPLSPPASPPASPPQSPPGSPPHGAAPLADGTYVVGIRAHLREITALTDPRIKEPALGGPDTTVRLKTVWQIHLVPATQPSPPGTSPVGCRTEFGEWTKLTTPPSGRMNARTVPADPDDNPCLLPPQAGYQRLENQLYRVVVHKSGPRAQARFKWSRENASIATAVESIAGNTVTVEDVGKDEVRGFSAGQWVELIDEASELRGEPRDLMQIDHVDEATREITMKSAVPALAGRPGLALVRWDQTLGGAADGLPMTTTSAGGWIPLEEGIQVAFEDGDYRAGDYWLIPARTATNEIEWPPHQVPNATPIAQRPAGIDYRYCRLALLTVLNGTLTLTDCREVFPPLTGVSAFLYVGGDGQEALPGTELPRPLQVGVTRGQGPVAGARVRYRVVEGAGSLTATSPAGTSVSGTTVETLTQADGIASCRWRLDANGNVSRQHVESTLLDVTELPLRLPVRFNAISSVAARIAYDPSKCADLAAANTVQEAIDVLCQRKPGGGCAVTVGKGGQFERLDEAIEKLQNERHICICLLPGIHELPRGLAIAGRRADVTVAIEACPRTAQLRLGQGEQIAVKGLASFTLRGVDLVAESGTHGVVITETEDVAIENCVLHNTSWVSNGFILVGNVERFRLRDSEVTAYLPWIPINVTTLPGLDIATPDVIRRRGDLRATFSQVTDVLAADRGLLSAFIEKFRGGLAGIPDLPAAFARKHLAVLDALGRVPPDLPGDLRPALIHDAVVRLSLGPALVFMNTGRQVTIENNDLFGAVRFCGEAPELDGATAARFAQEAVKKRFVGARGTVRMHGNRLSEVTVSSALQKNTTDAEVRGLYERVSFTDNDVALSENALFGVRVQVSSNYFAGARDMLAVALAETITITGNTCVNRDKTHILYAARVSPTDPMETLRRVAAANTPAVTRL